MTWYIDISAQDPFDFGAEPDLDPDPGSALKKMDPNPDRSHKD